MVGLTPNDNGNDLERKLLLISLAGTWLRANLAMRATESAVHLLTDNAKTPGQVLQMAALPEQFCFLRI